MNIEIKIQNEFGTFVSQPIEVNEEEYDHIITLSKQFYLNGYEMYTNDGFIVIPPEIVKKSILHLSVLNDYDTTN